MNEQHAREDNSDNCASRASRKLRDAFVHYFWLRIKSRSNTVDHAYPKVEAEGVLEGNGGDLSQAAHAPPSRLPIPFRRRCQSDE